LGGISVGFFTTEPRRSRRFHGGFFVLQGAAPLARLTPVRPALALVLLAAAGLLITACGAPSPEPAAPVQQAEMRHCTPDAPPVTSLGLGLQVLSPSPTERTIRLTNTRSAPVHLESVSTHMGFGPCGASLGVCEPARMARDLDLAPGQGLDLVVDAGLSDLRYPCTAAVLAVTVRLSETEQACSDVAAWTATR